MVELWEFLFKHSFWNCCCQFCASMRPQWRPVRYGKQKRIPTLKTYFKNYQTTRYQVSCKPTISNPSNTFRPPHLEYDLQAQEPYTNTPIYQRGGCSALSHFYTFARPSDNRASPETTTKQQKPIDNGTLSSPQCTAGRPPIFEGEHYPYEVNPISLKKAYVQAARDPYTLTPSHTEKLTTPSNAPGPYQDRKTIHCPLARALEVLHYLEMSEAADPADGNFSDIIRKVTRTIRQL